MPKISDFWDSTKDAIPRFATKLEALPPELAGEMTNMIREAVTEHVRVLPDRWLYLAAFIAAEDLYRKKVPNRKAILESLCLLPDKDDDDDTETKQAPKK